MDIPTMNKARSGESNNNNPPSRQDFFEWKQLSWQRWQIGNAAFRTMPFDKTQSIEARFDSNRYPQVVYQLPPDPHQRAKNSNAHLFQH